MSFIFSEKMERDGELSYIGRISLMSIRNFISDNQLSEIDTIRLHPKNFDSFVLDYREYYGESLKLPFFMFDTRIEEDIKSQVPADRVMVVVDESRPTKIEIENEPIYATIYRCGYCGNVVDSDGSEFDPDTRRENTRILEDKKNIVTQQHVRGRCCRKQW